MRLHRFFIQEQLTNVHEFATTDRDLIHQLKDVFRLTAGEKIILLDNSGYEFYCSLTLVSKDRVTMHIDEVKENNKPRNMKPYEVVLYQAIIKKDLFEWILEKATEIGVNRFVPILASRSEKKDINTERAEKIIREASEQSGRGLLPTLSPISILADVLKEPDIFFVAFHLEGEKYNSEMVTDKKRVGVLIGPEGGWTPEELDLMRKHKVAIVSLGSQTLRAETAAIAVSSLLLL
jgi:16S rRNA (uracil1498-N3)-methyltransferase